MYIRGFYHMHAGRRMRDAGLACGSGWFSLATRFHESVLCITIMYRISVVKPAKISMESRANRLSMRPAVQNVTRFLVR